MNNPSFCGGGGSGSVGVSGGERYVRLLEAIAVSSGCVVSSSSSISSSSSSGGILSPRQAYEVLQNDGPPDVGTCLELLRTEHFYANRDVTVPTHLAACNWLLHGHLKRHYTQFTEEERLALRHGVLSTVSANTTQRAQPQQQQQQQQQQPQPPPQSSPLERKLAAVLADLAVRDFPQRWTTFVDDLVTATGVGENSANGGDGGGTVLFLECLRLLTEDCTDGDFNARVSTARRNDVLIGLNEVSGTILGRIHAILSEAYGRVVNGGVFVTTTVASTRIVHACLTTLQQFCGDMPLGWMLPTTPTLSDTEGAPSPLPSTVTKPPPHDFVGVYLHLLRYQGSGLGDAALRCLQSLVGRKLEADQWYGLLQKVAPAVVEATAIATSSEDKKPIEDLVDHHRALSKMLSTLIFHHASHLTADKEMMSGTPGPRTQALMAHLNLMTEFLGHPMGPVGSEQTTTWLSLWRMDGLNFAKVLGPYVGTLLRRYVAYSERLDWSSSVDEELREATWDDEGHYDTWMADFRSKSSHLFRLIGRSFPDLAARVAREGLENVAASSDQPTACRRMDGMLHPLDNLLQGLPPWAVSTDAVVEISEELRQSREEVRSRTRADLGLCTEFLLGPSWGSSGDPVLKLRRAACLGVWKYLWKHDPTTLAAGVEVLMEDLVASPTTATATEEYSKEAYLDLRRRAGASLVSACKHLPERLVHGLSELCQRASTLMAMEDPQSQQQQQQQQQQLPQPRPVLLSVGRMHLLEALVCVSNAVEDVHQRSNFVAQLLEPSLSLLEAEVPLGGNFLEEMVGLTLPSGSESDPSVVDAVTQRYARCISAFQQILAVGKRCKLVTKRSVQEQNDDGPSSLEHLAASRGDAFAPVWIRLWPRLLSLTEALCGRRGLWTPRRRAELLGDPLRRYALAISDDELYLARAGGGAPFGGDNGGVFGKGGTAGSIVRGLDRRTSQTLVPKWTAWLSETRGCCHQLWGLCADTGALYVDEMPFQELLNIVASPNANDDENSFLRSVEHRHLTNYMKHFIDNVVLSCPSGRYQSHLGPLLRPFLEHVAYRRLPATWSSTTSTQQQQQQQQQPQQIPQPLTTSDCDAGNLRNSEEAYYARSGIFVGDLDDPAAREAVVEKARVDLTRATVDLLQLAMALRGEWALTLANVAKEEQAIKKQDPSILTSAPKSSFAAMANNNTTNTGSGCRLQPVNADGTPRDDDDRSLELRQLRRIDALGTFLLTYDRALAGPCVTLVVDGLAGKYPDAYTSRRYARLGHRLLEIAAHTPDYADAFTQMFASCVQLVVTEPKWSVGTQWETVGLLRDIYCRLVLGQSLAPGGQGPGLPRTPHTVTVDTPDHRLGGGGDPRQVGPLHPRKGGGVLPTPSEGPRHLLCSLPSIRVDDVRQLEADMTEKRAAKDQKDALRHLLSRAAEAWRDGSSHVYDGESLFRSADATHRVPNLPEPLVLLSKQQRQQGIRGVALGPDAEGFGTLFAEG